MSEPANKIGMQSLAYLEQFYADYRRDPESVPAEWRKYFATADNGDANGASACGPSFKARSIFNAAEGAKVPEAKSTPHVDPGSSNLSDRLYQLIRNYRVRGHIIAAIDPLGMKRPCPPELELEFYSFTESELNLLTNASTL